MAKRKKKKTKRPTKPEQPGWWESVEPERKRYIAWTAARVTIALAMAGGVGWAMMHLDRQVHAADRFSATPRIDLLDVPPELRDIMLAHLQPVCDVDWIAADLPRRIAQRLGESGWVRRVVKVRRLPDGHIEVRCRYREPMALVQEQDGFVLIDSEAVRLPGRYPYSQDFPLIQGVRGTAPAAGKPWHQPDLKAALKVLARVMNEVFADQVTAILVHNYGGREEPRDAHIQLATDRAGGRIIWGSAPGEEIEENTAEQKLAILRHNYELHGRIDAGLAVIDVSTFPDKFTTPTAALEAVVPPAEAT